MVKSKNVWFAPVLDLGLHVLIGDTIKVSYQLDAKNQVTNEMKEKAVTDPSFFLREAQERKILFGVQSIRETEKHLTFLTSNPGFMLLEKNTLALHWIHYVENEYLGLRLFKYFPHNGDDNRMMFIVSPEEWRNRNPYVKDDIPNRVKEQIDHVQANLKDDSNPILVFYKEKK